ncbi:MAG: DUF1841 family protein [Gammaproteobacteria bacterium]|jgi:hypothetical protein
MFFGNDRNALRRYYCDIWSRHRNGEPLDALGTQIARVIAEHPEYHALLEATDAAVEAEYTPEQGEANPFLHMGMHLAIREQAATDRPAGIAAVHARLAARLGPLEAEHQMMECLGTALWEAGRSGHDPDEAAYLECLKRL